MQFFKSSYQLREPFLYDVFDGDVVYLVMAAQLPCNCGLAHCWRSKQADSDWLQMNGWMN